MKKYRIIQSGNRYKIQVKYKLFPIWINVDQHKYLDITEEHVEKLIEGKKVLKETNWK